MIRFSCAIMLLLVLVGCGSRGEDKWLSQRPKTVPAQGVVTYKGAPVDGAQINFVPQQEAGTAAYAMSGEDGEFKLSSFGSNDGVVPGEYVVTISKMVSETILNPVDPNGPPVGRKEQYLVPKNYASVATSGLKATISESGENKFTFELKD